MKEQAELKEKAEQLLKAKNDVEEAQKGIKENRNSLDDEIKNQIKEREES